MEQHINNISEKIDLLAIHQNLRPYFIYNTFLKTFNTASNILALTFIL
jgi:hypothetical protein